MICNRIVGAQIQRCEVGQRQQGRCRDGGVLAQVE